MWRYLQLEKLQEYVKDCGGALPQGWTVRRIRCFGDRHRPLYIAPEVSKAMLTLQRCRIAASASTVRASTSISSVLWRVRTVPGEQLLPCTALTCHEAHGSCHRGDAGLSCSQRAALQVNVLVQGPGRSGPRMGWQPQS